MNSSTKKFLQHAATKKLFEMENIDEIKNQFNMKLLFQGVVLQFNRQLVLTVFNAGDSRILIGVLFQSL